MKHSFSYYHCEISTTPQTKPCTLLRNQHKGNIVKETLPWISAKCRKLPLNFRWFDRLSTIIAGDTRSKAHQCERSLFQLTEYHSEKPINLNRNFLTMRSESLFHSMRADLVNGIMYYTSICLEKKNFVLFERCTDDVRERKNTLISFWKALWFQFYLMLSVIYLICRFFSTENHTAFPLILVW